MPFAVFRRNQKTLVAALALFAMVAFTLDFSLLRFGGGVEDPEVVKLYDKPVKQSEINAMIVQRSRANRFMALIGVPTQSYFGGLDTASIVDALILQHEADQLGMPRDRELAVRWLLQVTDGAMNTALFNQIYRGNFASEVTDGQLLSEIANQVRLSQVRTLPGVPPVTPLDVFQAYKDQTERVSARLVPFPVDSHLDQTPMPDDKEIAAYFEKYKDVEADPRSPTPGFKIPRKLEVEFVMVDPTKRAQEIEPTLTEEELRAFFEANREDFIQAAGELPETIFAGEPALTPPLTDRFPESRPQVAQRLARERAELDGRQALDDLNDAIARFNDEIETARLEADLAEADGKAAPETPSPGDLMKSFAEGRKIEYEKTPPIERALAENYGRIGAARIGASAFDPGTSFVEEFFDSDRRPLEPVEMSDPLGRQFLAWIVNDQPARAPRLSEVRDEVVTAWRREKARELAQQAAQAFAKKVEQPGADLNALAQEEGKTVQTTIPVSKLMPGMPNPLNPFQPEPSRPSTIPDVPDAGEAFRNAYFALEPGTVAVQPNAPETVYYVMALPEKSQVGLEGLYSPFQGQRIPIQNEVLTEAFLERNRHWMEQLRADAGLEAGWQPPQDLR